MAVRALVLFIVANIAISGSYVFYDSLLPHIAAPDEIDRVSTAAYALGYLGGGILLAHQPAVDPDADVLRLAGHVAAIKLSFVERGRLVAACSRSRCSGACPNRQPCSTPARRAGESSIRTALDRVWETFHELRGYRQAFLMLVAFLLYNDGIQTIIRMATIYGAEIGIDRTRRSRAFVLVQFVGIPFSFLFGALARRIGAKPAIFVSLAVYIGISVLGYFMTTAWDFLVLAFLVGTVQGGSQALSRSLFARMIPRHKSSEFFGFFSVFEKFAGIAGPALFAVSVTLFGSSRAAVLSVILFFVLGALVLRHVDVAEGEAQALRAS